MSIKEGDRVQTIEGKKGTVEMLSEVGDMAYVLLDENAETTDYSLYELDRLKKINGEKIFPATH
jgi:hypothetical protein